VRTAPRGFLLFPGRLAEGNTGKIPLTTEAIAAPPNSIFYTSLLRSR
jgi:hypothetical protein